MLFNCPHPNTTCDTRMRKGIVLPVICSCFQWSKLKWIGSFVSYNWLFLLWKVNTFLSLKWSSSAYCFHVIFTAQIQHLIILITMYMTVMRRFLYSNFLTKLKKWNFSDHELFSKIMLRSMRNHDMHGLLLWWGFFICFRLSQRWQSYQRQCLSTFILVEFSGRKREIPF